MSRSTVLLVEDDEGLRGALTLTLKNAGYEVRAAADGEAALTTLAEHEAGLIITDMRMDGMDGNTLLQRVRQHHANLPVIVMTAYGTVQSAVEAMRNGAQDYLVKPFDTGLLLGKVAHYLGNTGTTDEPVANDERMQALFGLATRVAGSDVTLMISGESGTGKEVLAHYIHRRSRRASGAFVAINCAAIPENMLEAMLFGYEKGAFTGAVQSTPGKFEQAQGGTLLLDEISEMPLGLQAKLLRVLQEREVERLGGRRTIALDVRVMCTTNRHLREEVAAGRFREDLFYRLNVFPLHLPPLRERTQDILPLARFLSARLARAAGREAPTFSPTAEAQLLVHRWPGNVRELDNLIQRALVLVTGDTIRAEDLQFEAMAAGADETARPDDAGAQGDTLNRDLRSREQSLILDALKAGNGSRKHAAERLGISPRTLRYKLARLREAGVAIPG
ncbi:MAG: sigma-54-dependent Fis family transcriptional regulator [Gammaproteobacteria bacterium]|nr:MAG: sigma-54-dependent Fis family transcriptional regulator [Gammaproteobacteria bacterium]